MIVIITRFQVHSYFIWQLPNLLREPVSAKTIIEDPLTAEDVIPAFSKYTRGDAHSYSCKYETLAMDKHEIQAWRDI